MSRLRPPLPAKRSVSEGPDQARVAAPAAAREPLRVLFVEDRPSDVEMCLIELRRAGFDVTTDTVDTREEFISRLRTGKYDVVLSDYGLPGWNGLEALDLTRQLGGDIPFILITGSLGDEAAVDCVKRGAVDYVIKDRLSRLPVAVRQALAHARLRHSEAAAMRALEASEERYRSLVENSTDAILLLDEGRWTFANQAAARLFGAARAEDLIGRRMLESVEPALRDEVLQRIEHSALTGEINPPIERRLMRLDGTLVDVDVVAIPISEGGKIWAQVIIQDITSRKRSEEALRDSEERFRLLAESMPDAVLVGQDGKNVYANPAAARLLGAAGPQELIGREVSACIDPARHVFAGRQMQRVLAGEHVSPFEDGFVRSDGSVVPVEIGVTRLVWQGRPALHVVARDLTERMKAEETLRRQQSLVNTLMENVPDSIYFKDAASRFIRINHSLARLFGLSDPAEAVGKTDFDFFSEEHARAASETERRIMDTGEPVVNEEEMETWPDRPSTWVSSTKMPLRDAAGAIIGTFGISRDITRRKEAEEALRRSEAEHRGLVEHAPLGIYRSTPDGRLLSVNRAFVVMLGYDSAQEVLGLKMSPDLYADGEERDRLIAQVTEHDEAKTEVQWRRKDDSLITVQLNVRIVRGPTGEVECFEGLVEDVTQQRSLENQFRQAQRLEAVGRLAGGVAHDFNNVLTAITGYSELLLDEFEPGDRKRQDVEEIRAAAQRAAGLTRQLLAFSRKQVLQTRVLDLNAVIRTLEKMLQRLIGEDVKLEVSLSSALGAVRADPGQLEQVIMNLTVNSRDAMPRGGQLTIETANADLDETYAREHAGASPGRYVMLAVSDTGVGMDAETQSHIFEPFFTTKEQSTGTGLGLATVYGIVKQSGGYVWVYSEPGGGATFKIYLPRVEEPVEAPALGAAARPAAGGCETVLLAEDDPSVRAIVAEVLTLRGYRVLPVPDGQTALETARAEPGDIQLLVTDLIMPGMTGRELAEALARDRPHLRVLYMSGYTDDAVVRHGVLEEGMPYLQKPFTPQALASKVREVLDRSSVAAPS